MHPTHPAYLASPVLRREQSHRRAVLLGIAALLIFSTSPVFGHHVAGRADALLVGKDHLWFICLVAAHEILAPVHLAFHVLLVTGVGHALWDRARAARRSRQWLALLDGRVPAAGDGFARAAQRAGLAPERVMVVDDLAVPAFTAGWLRPRVYVARALAEWLAPEELVAVLAHEAAHVRHRDPLALSLLRSLSLVLWWIPAFRRLSDDAADEAEVRADDAAAREHPLVLASAILSLATWRTPPSGAGAPVTAVGFQRVDLLDRRIRRLAGEEAPIGTHLTRRSLGFAAVALATVWISGLMMVHPLPTAAAMSHGADHCEHHHSLAIMHLFCAGFATHHASGPCPHAALSRA